MTNSLYGNPFPGKAAIHGRTIELWKSLPVKAAIHGRAIQ
jgi:hypothetical protein